MTFTKETFSFLADLAANNDRDWFEANRDRYESAWLEPSKAFVEAMAAQMEALDPPHKAEARLNGSIRRINRDVRFSKDKRPYDPRIHIIFWTGDHPNRSPGIHVVIHADKLGAGAGHWGMGKDELERYRNAVVDTKTGGALQKIVDACAKEGYSLTEEALKRLPSGLPDDTGRDTLLKRKGLVMWTGDNPFPLSLLQDEKALSKKLMALAPLNRWLVGNVCS